MNIITFTSLRDELEKIAFDWHQFKEGIRDEGIPLAGATIGAGFGGLRGAALGYAAGGAASLAHSKLKGEEPSKGRAMLAGGALGYGLGGLAHAGASKAFANKAAKGFKGLASRALHTEGRFAHGALEEGLPAVGAVLGTGTAMGMHKEKVQPKGFGDKLRKAASVKTADAASLAAAIAKSKASRGVTQQMVKIRNPFLKTGSSGVNTFVNYTAPKVGGMAMGVAEAARKARIQALTSRPAAALKKFSSINKQALMGTSVMSGASKNLVSGGALHAMTSMVPGGKFTGGWTEGAKAVAKKVAPKLPGTTDKAAILAAHKARPKGLAAFSQ